MMMEKTVFALGFFDGVHLGHQALLSWCRRMAEDMGCKAGVITFSGHPEALVTGNAPGLINTQEDRERLFRRYGMERVIVLPFDRQLMTMPYTDFFQHLLDCGAAGLVCGEDFRFGYRGEGNAQRLEELCGQAGISCSVVPQQRKNGIAVSSSYIRNLLSQGELETAEDFLGHRHMLTGTVVAGRHLGRTIGIPTANLTLPDGLLVPRLGVYICLVRVGDQEYPAVANVGTRPTVGGHHVTVEPWILDFDGDLYGKEITVEFCRFLRPEHKYPSLEQLRQQIQSDGLEARKFFGK